jgi:hypothetical protein
MPLATSWTPWTIFVGLVQVALIVVTNYCTSILIQMSEPVKCQAPGVSPCWNPDRAATRCLSSMRKAAGWSP